jgi:hypothetical protein
MCAHRGRASRRRTARGPITRVRPSRSMSTCAPPAGACGALSGGPRARSSMVRNLLVRDPSRRYVHSDALLEVRWNQESCAKGLGRTPWPQRAAERG